MIKIKIKNQQKTVKTVRKMVEVEVTVTVEQIKKMEKKAKIEKNVNQVEVEKPK